MNIKNKPWCLILLGVESINHDFTDEIYQPTTISSNLEKEKMMYNKQYEREHEQGSFRVYL